MEIAKMISQALLNCHYKNGSILNGKNDMSDNRMMHHSIKPLEWQENDFIAITRTTLGLFKIDKYSFEIELIFGSYNGNSVLGKFKSIEDAKSAVESIWQEYLMQYLMPGDKIGRANN